MSLGVQRHLFVAADLRARRAAVPGLIVSLCRAAVHLALERFFTSIERLREELRRAVIDAAAAAAEDLEDCRGVEKEFRCKATPARTRTVEQ